MPSLYQKIFLCFLCILVSESLSSQNISLKSLSFNDELPSTTVQRIFQDKEGFMWFGTPNGLCRYDGYNILQIHSKLTKYSSILNDEITSFTEDNNNQLWIGTKLGLLIIDKKNYECKYLNNDNLNNTEIKALLTTSDNFIWIATSTSLLKYDSGLNLIKTYFNNSSISGISSLYEDNKKNLWVTIWANGLYKFDSDKDNFIEYPHIGSQNNPFALLQDKNNNYWISTWGDGIYSFNPDLKNPQNSTYTKQIIQNKNKIITEDTFFSITEDDKYGLLWFVSISGIYACKKKKGNELESIDLSNLFKESNNIFSQIIKDKSGNLWIGSFGEGVLNINFDKPQIKNYKLDDIKRKTGITTNITAIFVDRDGIMWLNQDRKGLILYNTTNNSIKYHDEIDALKNIDVMNVISCICGSSKNINQVWIGAENEPLVFTLDKRDDDISVSKRINLSEIKKNAGNPRKFFEDKLNNLWLITTNGLFVKKSTQIMFEPIDYNFGQISDITSDSQDNIWISSRNNGIYKINLDSDKNKLSDISNFNLNTPVLESNNIESIEGDKNGSIWIGTKSDKIIEFNTQTNTFRQIENLISWNNDIILDIISDQDGHIWISMNKRIVDYNSKNGAIRYYNMSDGIVVNSFGKHSYFQDNKNKIYFGGNKGISVFQTSETLSTSIQKKKVYVTDVKVNSKSLLQNDSNQLNLIDQTITLNPNDKNIEINFSSLNYSFPSKIRYAYKMENIDKDWIYTEADHQFAIYNHLDKGSYTLLIKSTDENGMWSDDISKITIYKKPALYETWWAYSIYVIVCIIIGFLIYKVFKKRILLENNLKIIQIEKEKSEELNQVKLKYFTNISHEFLTPLTIISCLINDIENQYNKTSYQFNAMRANIDMLKRLLQQILDFRKIEKGTLSLLVKKDDIISFLRNICINSFVPLFKNKNIEFIFESNKSELEAYFDSDKIDKIIYNLLSNAYKYTQPDGLVKVSVNDTFQSNNHYITISVQDTGIGISEEDLKHIFTSFHSNSINKSSDSNGIGLNLTKEFVEIHKGSIKVNSKIGVGSVFSVTIPIDTANYKEHMEDINSEILIGINSIESFDIGPEDDTLVESSQNKNINLLLVEDNEELIVLMNKILSKQYNVITASNGKEAIFKIEKNKVDIIISDVMMPEMDGIELCKQIKSNIETSHIPVLLLTARNSSDDQIECYKAGADGYLSKPFDLKTLEARINNLVSTKKTEQQKFKVDININPSQLNYTPKDEQFLNNTILIIEENLLEESFDVVVLSEKLNMSKSSLYRKIKSMTDLSPSDFIRNIRLKHACSLLKDKSINISEVAYAVGFSDPKYFTICFKNEFGLTPSEFQRNN